jgi:multidrug efflux system membrane fusion protein
VKTVDDENVVHFYPIEIARAEIDGIWVTGLPDTVRLITVGQGFVNDGETVRPQAQDHTQ